MFVSSVLDFFSKLNIPAFMFRVSLFAFRIIFDFVFQVYVTLNDENDNPPFFGQPEYLQQIIETIPIYTHVLQVFANDADAGNNARLAFTKVPGSGDADSMYTYNIWKCLKTPSSYFFQTS